MIYHTADPFKGTVLGKAGSRRRRGFAYERELARELWNRGFACIRAPASGAKVRRRAQPDLVAMKNGVILVFEVKTRRKEGHVYIDAGQVEKLLEFARRAGGMAFIAVKILDGRGWRFVPAERLSRTRGGSFKVGLEEVERGLRLRDLEVLVSGAYRSLDEYIGDGETRRAPGG